MAPGEIGERIRGSFGTLSAFNQRFIAAATDHFASGWVWLTLDGESLRIETTSNAETPLTGSTVPLLTLDLWEHAYYLDYEHRRLDYVAGFLANLIDWETVSCRLSAAEGARQVAEERLTSGAPEGPARRTARA